MNVSLKLMCFCAFLLITETQAQQLGTFLAKHKNAVENYIMTGYGRGWDQCDVVADQFHAESALGAVPQLIMELQKLKSLETNDYLSSHCLLVTYHVKRKEDLEALVEFGKSVIMNKRLSLVLRLGSDISLDALNRTGLPILVGAVLNNGKEQFLCPAVGEKKSLMQDHMCGQNYTSYKNKVLRIGMLGFPPNLKVTNSGIYPVRHYPVDGVDFHLLQLLVKRKNFVANITIPKHLPASIAMVSIILYYYNLVRNLSLLLVKWPQCRSCSESCHVDSPIFHQQ